MANFTSAEKKILRDAVDAAIKYGLEYGKKLRLDFANYSAKLREPGASFVTLELDGNLRGCIGSLEAHQPLIADVADNAYNAAFNDPRFYPLQPDEYARLTKHISILSKPELLSFTSEADLLHKIRPQIDGLILSDNFHRGTFLPSVWESLPTPELFWRHLKLKAGLPENYWSDTLKVERYITTVV